MRPSTSAASSAGGLQLPLHADPSKKESCTQGSAPPAATGRYAVPDLRAGPGAPLRKCKLASR
eukprot:15039069-Heterocapsa_arctica.AAC.1